MGNKRKPKTGKRKIRKSFIAVVAMFFLCIAVILSTTVLFPINEVAVEYTEGKYTRSEIINNSGISVGSNIIMLNSSDVEERLTRLLPYVGSVEISKSLFGTVTLTVKETGIKYCLKDNNKYYLTDKDNKLLEIKDKIYKKAVCIKGVDFSAEVTGKRIKIKNESLINTANKIVKSIEQFGRTVNYLDMSVRSDVKIYIDKKYSVNFGNMNDYGDKMKFLGKMLDGIEKKNKKDKGEIDLRHFSVTKEGYFKHKEIKIPYFK